MRRGATAIRSLYHKEIIRGRSRPGGADRESAKELRKNVPASAMFLGRCVSLSDFSARVASTVADDATMAARIVHGLQKLVEPGMMVRAQQAIPIHRTMRLRVSVDRDYVASAIKAARLERPSVEGRTPGSMDRAAPRPVRAEVERVRVELADGRAHRVPCVAPVPFPVEKGQLHARAVTGS